jgi:exonuclease-1
MGISGLLQFLKEFRKEVDLADWKGETIAVDASCWIHQGAYHADFSEGLEGVVLKIVHYITKRLRMLELYQINTIIVFDGESLEIKKWINERRIKQRNDCKDKIAALIREGRMEEANK